MFAILTDSYLIDELTKLFQRFWSNECSATKSKQGRYTLVRTGIDDVLRRVEVQNCYGVRIRRRYGTPRSKGAPRSRQVRRLRLRGRKFTGRELRLVQMIKHLRTKREREVAAAGFLRNLKS